MDKQKYLDELFRHAKEQNPVVTFSRAKEHFLTAIETNSIKMKGEKVSFLLTKKLILMIVAVSTLIVALFFSNSQINNKSTSKFSSNVPAEKKKNSEIIENSVGQLTDPAFKLVELLPNFTHIFPEANQFSVATTDTLNVKENRGFIKSHIPIFSDEYVFPKLTEEEIKANNKRKKAMLKALEKFDRKIYTFLLSGSFDYLGEMTSVQTFLIQKTEVSNLEYRTFLFDLLLQGRKDDFLKAKPDQNQWILSKGQNSQMKEHYFSHFAYNHFPVVNISREGAEMYCKWFSQELDKVVEEKKRNFYNDVRIPMREEWVMAASIEGKNKVYPWEGEQTQNSEGCYLANYKPFEGSDSISYKADGGFYTVRVDSYFPNDFGLYNMSGNVAEMVNVGTTTRSAGTAGGGWMNTAEEIKILGSDPYAGITDPHPCIGFRVVMTVK
jgi:hypothetical protein